MNLIILKTDLLFLLVLAGVVGYVFIVLRDDNLSRTWKKVFQRPLAASAALIFTFYIFNCFRKIQLTCNFLPTFCDYSQRLE